MYCDVLVTKPFDQVFTYKAKSGQNIVVGSVVSVPFGKKNDQLGLVYNLLDPKQSKNFKFAIKEINSVHQHILISKNIIKFIEWVSDYTLAPKGLVLKLFLVNNKIISHKLDTYDQSVLKGQSVELNSDQQKAFDVIDKNLPFNPKPIVLEGVTGSGKTEVFFEVVEKFLKKKKQILIMLPEISLTPQLEMRIEKRFGFLPLVWHSKISDKKRKEIWNLCYKGRSKIIIGARSSLFLPFKNLGLIIVDEEHDLSYKQEENIRYQARDLAIVRSKIEKIPIILSSATPSIETQNNVQKGKFLHVFLPNQFSGLELPNINLIDLKKEKLKKNSWISDKALIAIKDCLNKEKQALLFLNRRGYSPLSLCSSCGHRFHCDHCSSWLVMHRKKKRLLCHHCGNISSIEKDCPKCKKENSIKFIGPGIERLEEEIKNHFPNSKISTISSDLTNTPLQIKKITDKFASKKIDILVATQIMSKGYHFPDLSLVCVIDADAGLMGGDIKAIEKTYNLLEQVSGRAGRSNQIGNVFIQTFYPNQPLMLSLKNRKRKKFINQCLYEREQFNMPPFSFMTAIILSGSSKSKTESYALKLSHSLNLESKIELFGPVEAPLFLLRGKYRFRLLLKSKNRRLLNNFTRKMIKNCPAPGNIRLTIDVDPYTFV